MAEQFHVGQKVLVSPQQGKHASSNYWGVITAVNADGTYEVQSMNADGSTTETFTNGTPNPKIAVRAGQLFTGPDDPSFANPATLSGPPNGRSWGEQVLPGPVDPITGIYKNQDEGTWQSNTRFDNSPTHLSGGGTTMIGGIGVGPTGAGGAAPGAGGIDNRVAAYDPESVGAANLPVSGDNKILPPADAEFVGGWGGGMNTPSGGQSMSGTYEYKSAQGYWEWQDGKWSFLGPTGKGFGTPDAGESGLVKDPVTGQMVVPGGGVLSYGPGDAQKSFNAAQAAFQRHAQADYAGADYQRDITLNSAGGQNYLNAEAANLQQGYVNYRQSGNPNITPLTQDEADKFNQLSEADQEEAMAWMNATDASGAKIHAADPYAMLRKKIGETDPDLSKPGATPISGTGTLPARNNYAMVAKVSDQVTKDVAAATDSSGHVDPSKLSDADKAVIGAVMNQPTNYDKVPNISGQTSTPSGAAPAAPMTDAQKATLEKSDPGTYYAYAQAAQHNIDMGLNPDGSKKETVPIANQSKPINTGGGGVGAGGTDASNSTPIPQAAPPVDPNVIKFINQGGI